MNCERCGAEVSESLSECTSCGTFSGYPNVRIARKPEEVEALDSRYLQALIEAEERGLLEKVERFERNVQTQSQALVSMDVDTLRALATRENELFSNYALRIKAQVRKPASLSDDQRRRAVDGRLWGSFGEEIRYAALSLNGRGLSSYGDCFATLRNLHVEHRSSVLERNSFEFVEVAPSKPLPEGFRSDWANRHKVAVTKCARLIKNETTDAEFPAILLESGTSRQNDEFIEVHVYGPFDFKAIEAISTSGKIKETRDILTLKIVKKRAIEDGKTWL
jgi:hypothetical protein